MRHDVVIHYVVVLTTVPQPLPQRVLHRGDLVIPLSSSSVFSFLKVIQYLITPYSLLSQSSVFLNNEFQKAFPTQDMTISVRLFLCFVCRMFFFLLGFVILLHFNTIRPSLAPHLSSLTVFKPLLLIILTLRSFCYNEEDKEATCWNLL